MVGTARANQAVTAQHYSSETEYAERVPLVSSMLINTGVREDAFHLWSLDSEEAI